MFTWLGIGSKEETDDEDSSLSEDEGWHPDIEKTQNRRASDFVDFICEVIEEECPTAKNFEFYTEPEKGKKYSI